MPNNLSLINMKIFEKIRFLINSIIKETDINLNNLSLDLILIKFAKKINNVNKIIENIIFNSYKLSNKDFQEFIDDLEIQVSFDKIEQSFLGKKESINNIVKD
jgi:hypothetical protein